MAKLYIRTMERIVKITAESLLVILLLSACKAQKSNTVADVLVGNWWYCDTLVGYTEIYILNDTLLMFNDRIIGTSVRNYIVNNKSILLTYPEKVVFKISDYSMDEMKVETETGPIIIIHRLFDEINLDDLNGDDDDFTRFGAAFVKRAEKCANPTSGS